jgi:hypothetical protein
MGLNATLVTLTPNTIAHAADVNTSLTNLNAANSIINGSDTTQVIGFSLHGSSDCGISNDVNVSTVASTVNNIIKFNNYWNGSVDKFTTTQSFPAYQLSVSGAGIAVRKSTTNATAGGTITWGSFTILFS